MTDLDISEGRTSICILCGQKAANPELGATLRTFTVGSSPDNAFCGGVIMLCDEHANYDIDLLALLNARLSQIFEVPSEGDDQ